MQMTEIMYFINFYVLYIMNFHLRMLVYMVFTHAQTVYSNQHPVVGSISCAIACLASEECLAFQIAPDRKCLFRSSAQPTTEEKERRKILGEGNSETRLPLIWRIEPKPVNLTNKRVFIFTTKPVAPVECPIPSEDADSTITYTSLTPGSKANYSCKDQYSSYCGLFVKTVECLANGTWETFFGSCAQTIWLNPKMEFDVQTSCYLGFGSAIEIIGTSGTEYGIHFHLNDNILLFIFVRLKRGLFTKREIGFNSWYPDTKWGNSESLRRFDLRPNKQAFFRVTMTKVGFNVELNRKIIKLFKHRMIFANMHVNVVKVKNGSRSKRDTITLNRVRFLPANQE